LNGLGSALIGVFDIDCPKQRLPAHTNIWDAPEKAEPMDALSLRRMDTYSYGLAVWTIMCNGGDPYQRLSWDLDHKTIISEPPASLKTRIKEKEIPSMKQNGDSLLRLAIETLKGRPNSDIEAGRVQRVLEVTIRRDPAARASSFDDIVKLWGPGRVQACLR
jgi:serine/threonine protein kinase